MREEFSVREGRLREAGATKREDEEEEEDGGGWRGKWEGLCRSEADVLTSRLADQWDAVIQQSDPYALTLLWTAEGRGGMRATSCVPIYIYIYIYMPV